jgi:hypothetical protein
MSKIKFLTSTLLLGFSILILNGCGSQATAKKVVGALEKEDYDLAI